MQRRTAAEHEIAAVRVGMRQMLSAVGRRARVSGAAQIVRRDYRWEMQRS